MLNFDPQECRKRLHNDVGGYAWTLRRSVEKIASDSALGSYASFDLEMAIECLLVRYDRPALQLLNRARSWLMLAFANNERPNVYSKGGTEAHWHLDLALCNWLLGNQHDEENFRLYVQNEEYHLSNTHLAQDKREISFVLPHYVDAGAYREALARYDGAGLAPPTGLGAIRTEGQMSYVLCRQQLGEDYEPAGVEAATDRFLSRSLHDWLRDGNWSRAAEWMKIRHWNGRPGASAVQALMKCYDYIPGVEPPPDRRSWIPAWLPWSARR
jgi:hypothetical protein